MNLFLEKIDFYFSAVNRGAMKPDEAVNNLLLEFGGSAVFVPKKRISKREMVVREYMNGLTAKQISDLFGVSKNYVYRIITEHNGEEFRKRKNIKKINICH